MRKVEDEVVALPSRAALARWFATHHEAKKAMWLRIAKKGASETSASYAEAVELALVHGWIDGQKRSLDEEFWLQRFTPRTKKSPWSKINREKAEALIAAKKMKPAGLAQVEAAKADGRWARAYAGAKTAEVPLDLSHALAKNARARRFFEALDSANRYAILYRLHHAANPERRARKLKGFIAMLAGGGKLHRPKRR